MSRSQRHLLEIRGLNSDGLRDVDARGGVSTAVLDSAHKSSGLILSNGNLTASRTALGDGQQWSVTGTTSISSGKKFYSVHIDAFTAGDAAMGLASTGRALNAGISAGGAMALNVGAVYGNGGYVGGVDAFASGNTVDVAYDADANTIAYRVNGGSWSSNLNVSFLTKPVFPCLQFYNGNGETVTMTVNFGATAYLYAPPVGFGKW